MLTAVIVLAYVPLAWLSVRALRRALRGLDGGTAARGAMWGMLLALAGVIVSIVMLVPAFGTVAYAEPSSKATLLARGISEAINCGAMAIVPGLVFGFLGGLLRGMYGKPRQDPRASA
jgi:hypothetical protein